MKLSILVLAAVCGPAAAVGVDRRLDDASIADGTAAPAFEPTLLPSTGKGKGGGSKEPKGGSKGGTDVLASEPTIISSSSSSAGKASKGRGPADTEVSFPLLGRNRRRHRRRLGSKGLKSKAA